MSCHNIGSGVSGWQGISIQIRSFHGEKDVGYCGIKVF